MTPTYLAADGAPHAAYLVQGEDPGLVSQVLSALVGELASLDDAGAVPIEEYGEVGRPEANQTEPFSLGPVLDACRTPPFLAPRRVVVVRDAASLDAAQARELIGYLEDPLETTVLVVVCSGRRASAALANAIRADRRRPPGRTRPDDPGPGRVVRRAAAPRAGPPRPRRGGAPGGAPR